MTSDRFGRYLLGELLWELNYGNREVPGLTDVAPEQIEVLSYSGYDTVRLRIASRVFEAQLSWKGQVAPVVVEIEESGAEGTLPSDSLLL